jgi:hypothetical protein
MSLGLRALSRPLRGDAVLKMEFGVEERGLVFCREIRRHVEGEQRFFPALELTEHLAFVVRKLRQTREFSSGLREPPHGAFVVVVLDAKFDQLQIKPRILVVEEQRFFEFLQRTGIIAFLEKDTTMLAVGGETRGIVADHFLQLGQRLFLLPKRVEREGETLTGQGVRRLQDEQTLRGGHSVFEMAVGKEVIVRA